MSYIDLAIDAMNKYKKAVKANEASDKVFGSKLKDTDFTIKIHPEPSITNFFKPRSKSIVLTEEYAKQVFYRYKIYEYKTLLNDYIHRLSNPAIMFYANSNAKNNLSLKQMAEKYVHALTNIEKVYANKNDHPEFDEAVYDFVVRVKRNLYIENIENVNDQIEPRITNIISVNESNQNFANEIIAYTAGGSYLVKPESEKESGLAK